MDTNYTLPTMRMVARWADEAVKAMEAGDERHAIRCYALMFGAIARSTGDARRLFKAGLDKGERNR